MPTGPLLGVGTLRPLPFTFSQNPMQEEPQVWTLKGYFPASQLEVRCQWTDTEDYIKCEPQYFLKETGEFVKNDCYVYLKKALVANLVQGAFQ